jgi:LPS export ABC transporter protein LptC
MKKTKLFPIVIIALIIGAYLFYHFYYNNSSKEKMPTEDAIDQVVDDIIIHEPPVRIEQGEVLGIKDEKKEWLIEADSISIGQDRESTLFENIKQMIIFKDEVPHLSITAEKCIANMQSKDMELKGNVIISKEDGDSLRGERVFWYSEEERLLSNEMVELQVDDNLIVAGSFSANKEMTQLELYNRVTVIMKL